MSVFDFRGFLDDLDSKGELFRVPVEVDTLDEMGAFIARADYKDIHSPILFEKPKGFDIPVLANTVGHTYRRMADAFGVPEENALPGNGIEDDASVEVGRSGSGVRRCKKSGLQRRDYERRRC